MRVATAAESQAWFIPSVLSRLHDDGGSRAQAGCQRKSSVARVQGHVNDGLRNATFLLYPSEIVPWYIAFPESVSWFVCPKMKRALDRLDRISFSGHAEKSSQLSLVSIAKCTAKRNYRPKWWKRNGTGILGMMIYIMYMKKALSRKLYSKLRWTFVLLL